MIFPVSISGSNATSRRSPQSANHICFGEVVAFVQQREPARLRQSIGHAITEIKTGGMPPFTEANERRSAFACQLLVKGDDFNGQLLY
jgi:hypothetical protein